MILELILAAQVLTTMRAVTYFEAGEYGLAAACLSETGALDYYADSLSALELYEEEALVRGRIGVADPADAFNLASVLDCLGHEVEPLLREVAARTHPADELFADVLEALAEMCERPEKSWRIRAQAEDWRDHQW